MILYPQITILTIYKRRFLAQRNTIRVGIYI